MSEPKIAIIGAGLAGLNAAYQFHKQGIKATVYEAKAYPGGRIQSQSVCDGLIIDLGAHFIYADHADVLELVREFDLALIPHRAPVNSACPAACYDLEGEKRSPQTMARQMSAIARQIARDVEQLQRDFAQFAARWDRYSVAQYLDYYQHLIVVPYIRSLIEAGFRSEYGTEPESASALELLLAPPSILEDGVDVGGAVGGQCWTIRGGCDRLIHSLAKVLGDSIQTSSPLLEIAQQDSHFVLQFPQSQAIADYVILALPFPALRKVKLNLQLPPQLQRFIAQSRLGVNEKIFIHFRERVWQRRDGFSSELWSDRGFCAWESTPGNRDRPDALMTFFLSGDRAFTPEQLLDHFDTIIPQGKAAASGQYFRTHWREDADLGGAYSSYQPGQLQTFAPYFYRRGECDRVNIGNLFFAGEQLSYDFYGYMNAAAQTGKLAAKALWQQHRRL